MNACHELSPLPKETSVNPRFASLDQDTLNNQGFTSLEQDPEDTSNLSFRYSDNHVMNCYIFVAANGQLYHDDDGEVPNDSEHLLKNMKVLTPHKTRSSGSTSEMRPSGGGGGGSLEMSDDVVIAMGEVRPSRGGSR